MPRSLTCVNATQQFLTGLTGIILIALALAFNGCSAEAASASGLPAPRPTTITQHHDQGDFLPSLPTWAQQRIMSRGYGLYKMDARTATFPGGSNSPASTINRCMVDEEKNTTIPWYDVTNDPNADVDLIFYMPDSYPNDGSAGVSYYTNAPAFINVNFRLGYTLWDSTYCHEFGHTNGEQDFYYHPLTCNTAAKWTIMSCGTGIGTLQSLDRNLQLSVYIPDLPSRVDVVNANGFIYPRYNGYRMSSAPGICTPFADVAFNYSATLKNNYCGHYNRLLDNATRVSYFVSDDGGATWIWLPWYGDRPWTAQPDQMIGRGFDRAYFCPSWSPNRLWGLRPESAVPGTWYGWPQTVPYLSGDIAVAGRC